MASDKAEKNHFVQTIVKELREENLAVFAGAGLSVPAGFVSWQELLKPIAEELNLDVEREQDLISLAQYYTNQNQGNRGRLNQLLIDEFCQDAQITESHRVLARLPISVYWTTNYDKLIELALNQAGKIPDVKFTKKHLVTTRRRRDAIVYKMHGDADHASEAVLIKDDYEKYHLDRQPYLDALKGDLISKTFLFLGFSFTDPNLDYILSRVRVAYDSDQRQHFCILREVKKRKQQKKAEHEYEKRKQELFIQDLLRFGIKTLLVEEYNEITEILGEIERQFSRTTIFISGAAHDYSPFTGVDVQAFVYGLSQDIITSKCNIVSGFGLGIADAVVAGAITHIYKTGGTLHAGEQLVLRPFPQNISGKENRGKLWTHYRKDMLSHAGIALFLFGNKCQNNMTVLSDGMREEFEIAKEKGLFLLPVGATGYMAKELWNEVNAGFDSLYPDVHKDVKSLFAKLDDENAGLMQLRSRVMDIIKILTK